MTHIHFIAIGGIGMSGLAKVSLEQGHVISGCDLAPSDLAWRLAKSGASIVFGHDPSHLDGVDLVVVSAAVPVDNPELAEARRRRIPVLKRSEMLGQLMAQGTGIAVAGTHGKTTTTALVTYLLAEAGLDPTFLVGGELVNLDTNAAWGQSRFVVAEADEYDGAFLHLHPLIAVVTNIEPEHLDFYGTFEKEVDAFYQFLELVPAEGWVVINADDPTLRQLLERGLRAQVVSYGLGPAPAWGQAHWQARALAPNQLGGYDFTLWRDQEYLGAFSSSLPGRHNVSNATAALAVGSLAGIAWPQLQDGLASFRGVRRRFEVIGEAWGVTIIDDYAHHPTEIQATLLAARERFPGRRLLAVFQPHTFSRTKHLLADFAVAFELADQAIIADIYPSRERDTLGISSRDLVAAMTHPQASYGGSLAQTIEASLSALKPGDVLLALGAGDITRLSAAVLEEVRRR